MPTLYVVATPIGNLSDMSPRVAEALRSCALVAAEDTRVTAKLLNHLQLSRPLISCHEHNEQSRAPQIARRMLDEDIDVALCCDAGTPAISDPGVELVRAAWETGIAVIPVPGPSAVVTAISASGFDAREFAFYGFLPRENKPLREKLLDIARGPKLAVVYESPHRVVDLMAVIADTLPGCECAVCCDLTKRFERIERGPAPDVLTRLRANANVEKGEYCIALSLANVSLPEPPAPPVEIPPELLIVRALMDGMDMKSALKELAAQGVSRNDAYAASLKVKRWLDGNDDIDD